MMDIMPKIVMIVLVAMLLGSMSQAQTTVPKLSKSPADSYAPATAGKTEPTLLSVADEYVKVVGGAITLVGTVLGFPLVYQTFRKTRAEIAKIDLEAAKLRKELDEKTPGESTAALDGYRIHLEGGRNGVNILTDPRWAAPLLVLVDAFIASIFSTVANYAIGFLTFPLPYITRPVQLVVYLVIFYPVFRTARRVKKSLGARLPVDQSDTQPHPTEPLA